MKSVLDLIIRIKNGYMARKATVTMPVNKMVVAVLKKLVATGYIAGFEIEEFENKVKKTAHITLKYDNGAPALINVKIVSKPGQRAYVEASEIPTVLNGLGIALLSTNAGILTSFEARKAHVGGELLFTIW
jgi:small subunit ribosomal protein S8